MSSGLHSKRSCEVCGVTYQPTYGGQRTCGRPCGVVLRLRNHPPKGKTPRPPRQLKCPSCGGTFVAHGVQRYCNRRCQYWYGRPVMESGAVGEAQPFYRSGSFVDRLLSRYVVEDSGCWRWIGTLVKTSGYGQIGRDGGNVPAHVAMYEHHRGPVPDGLHLDHLCRNRACVNPEHLEPVTQAENNRRARASL